MPLAKRHLRPLCAAFSGSGSGWFPASAHRFCIGRHRFFRVQCDGKRARLATFAPAFRRSFQNNAGRCGKGELIVLLHMNGRKGGVEGGQRDFTFVGDFFGGFADLFDGCHYRHRDTRLRNITHAKQERKNQGGYGNTERD